MGGEKKRGRRERMREGVGRGDGGTRERDKGRSKGG